MTIEHNIPGTQTFVTIPAGELLEITVEGEMRTYKSLAIKKGAYLMAGSRVCLGGFANECPEEGGKPVKAGVTFLADGGMVVVRTK